MKMARRDNHPKARKPMAAMRHAGSVTETVVALIGAQVLVAFVPMRRWRGFFPNGAAAENSAPSSHADMVRAHGLGRQVERVANAFPWTVKCLPRALAASAMLTRRHIGSRLAIGARRRDKDAIIELHAWLMVDGECVVGREERETYRDFVPPGTTSLGENGRA